jgi:hypothetical protein
MGLFDRFKKKDDSVLPSEVDDYYKSELKNRRSSSVFMAILALVITLVVAAGLFFGGQAIYRAVNDDNPSNPAQDTGNDQGNNSDGFDDSIYGPLEGDSNENGEGQPNEESEPSEQEDQPPSNNGEAPSTGDEASEGIPSTGDSADALPSTGDN